MGDEKHANVCDRLFGIIFWIRYGFGLKREVAAKKWTRLLGRTVRSDSVRAALWWRLFCAGWFCFALFSDGAGGWRFRGQKAGMLQGRV